MTPDELERQLENHRRLQAIVDRGLAEEGRLGRRAVAGHAPADRTRRRRRMPPEELERQLENHRRLQEIVERRLAAEAAARASAPTEPRRREP